MLKPKGSHRGPSLDKTNLFRKAHFLKHNYISVNSQISETYAVWD